MVAPVSAQVVDGTSKSLVGLSIVYRMFLLSSIYVDRVAMAKTMGIVVAHNRLPLAGMEDLDLDGVLDDSLALPPVRAAETSYVQLKIHQPRTVGSVGLRHDCFPELVDLRVEHILLLRGFSRDDLDMTSCTITHLRRAAEYT